MFDELFGGMFDFNRDGTTDTVEEITGFAVLDDLLSDGSDSDTDFDFDFDSDDDCGF